MSVRSATVSSSWSAPYETRSKFLAVSKLRTFILDKKYILPPSSMLPCAPSARARVLEPRIRRKRRSSRYRPLTKCYNMLAGADDAKLLSTTVPTASMRCRPWARVGAVPLTCPLETFVLALTRTMSSLSSLERAARDEQHGIDPHLPQVPCVLHDALKFPCPSLSWARDVQFAQLGIGRHPARSGSWAHCRPRFRGLESCGQEMIIVSFFSPAAGAL